jgi:quercetin dioxygenase-like cupin family protein
MLTAAVRELDLQELSSTTDDSLNCRFAFPFYAATGTTDSAVVYFEIEPGKRLGVHHDSAEEIVLVLEGTGEATIGDERGTVSKGDMAVIPAWAPHGFVNTGDSTLKVVGFFSGATLIHRFPEPVIPGEEMAFIVHDKTGESVYAGASLPVPVPA